MGKTTSKPSKPHFFIFFIPDLLEKFSIPETFCREYLVGEKCEGDAVLRTNRSHKSWTVSLQRSSFEDGWRDFVRANNLRVGDLLVFKYQGHFVFDVLVFDNTLCERECNVEVPGKLEDHQKVARPKTTSSRSHHSRHFTVTLAPSHLKWRSLGIPAKFTRENNLKNKLGQITLRDPKGKSWQVMLRYKQNNGLGSSGYATIGGGWVEFSNANKLKVGDICRFKLLSGGTKKVEMEVSVSKSKPTSCARSS